MSWIFLGLGPGFVSPPKNVVLEQLPIDCTQTSPSVSPSIFASTAYHDVVHLASGFSWVAAFGPGFPSPALNKPISDQSTNQSVRPSDLRPSTIANVPAARITVLYTEGPNLWGRLVVDSEVAESNEVNQPQTHMLTWHDQGAVGRVPHKLAEGRNALHTRPDVDLKCVESG